jgi:hypothetical protein
MGEPPGGLPDVQHGDGDVTLTWRGIADAEGATLEATLLTVLQFVAGTGISVGTQLCSAARLCCFHVMLHGTTVTTMVLVAPAGGMLQGDTEMVQELGALLWPRLASKYVELRLAAHPPADGAQGARRPPAPTVYTCFC